MPGQHRGQGRRVSLGGYTASHRNTAASANKRAKASQRAVAERHRVKPKPAPQSGWQSFREWLMK